MKRTTSSTANWIHSVGANSATASTVPRTSNNTGNIQAKTASVGDRPANARIDAARKQTSGGAHNIGPPATSSVIRCVALTSKADGAADQKSHAIFALSSNFAEPSSLRCNNEVGINET